MRSSKFIAIFLLIHYSLVAIHPDIHIRGPEDKHLEDQVNLKRLEEEADKVLQDPSSSEDQKAEALQKLDKAGLLA